ncbi:hypothetical protein [Arenivirga flava]|nr:hypothetical protein [Arenivirga flava]
MLAVINEYQSKASGADIAFKMGEKARRGGTLGKAKLGYLNVIDSSEGRQIRTVGLDPIGPLRQARVRALRHRQLHPQ